MGGSRNHIHCTIERGIRQICSLSALIFITAVEILANRIRNEKHIRGFEIKLNESNHSIKISQLADDTTLFYGFSYYYRFSDIAINSVNPSFI
jgi:hypothetical protein